MPEAVALPFSLEDNVMLGVFDLDLCLGKNSCAVVVAKLANGD
jgi:type II secretory pathway component PulL